MTDHDYFHGFAPEEQRRLVRQAEYWHRSLIPLGLDYRAGEHVLEIGCAAGGTLGVLATLFPDIEVAGIDLEPRQIEFARDHLASLGVRGADLQVGHAAHLPWDENRFDQVYIMWVIEHLEDPNPVLREAYRVLRSGGGITLTETDYSTFKIWPPSEDWDLLEQAQYRFFARHGNPIAGRLLGTILTRCGFGCVCSTPVGYHFFHGEDPASLRNHVDYVADFLEPGLDKMAALGYDRERLRRGLSHLRSISTHPEGSMTQIVYRAHARKHPTGGDR